MNMPETLTPENARAMLDGMPKRLADELANRALHLVMKNDELRWRYKSNNPCVDKKLIFDPEDYIGYLRMNYFDELQEGGVYVGKPLLLRRLMRMLYEHEQAAPTHEGQTIDIGISWNASPMSPAQSLRNAVYWKLSKKDLEFLRYIRVASTDGGGMSNLVVYVKSDAEAEVYKLVGPLNKVHENDILGVLSTVKSDKGTLLEELESEYQEHVEEMYAHSPDKFHLNMLGMIRNEDLRDGDVHIEYFAYTFRDYLKHARLLLHHKKLRLKSEPVTISNRRSVPSFFYFNRKKLKEGLYQAWTDWMLVIPEDYRPVFMAWIYSIFVPENTGRQALWLQSSGYDGKSQMINAIAEFLGGVGYGSVNSKMVKTQFAYAAAYGKRLISFPDCQNEQFMRSSFVHTILGGDTAPIEFKGKDIFTSRLFCKFIIGSNKAPQVDVNAMHELTRIIYIPLQKPPEHIQKRFYATDDDGNILYDRLGHPHPIGFKGTHKHPELKDMLVSEMSAFLHACGEHYERLCPHDKEIQAGDKVREALYLTCISQEAEAYDDFIAENYEFTDEIKDTLCVLEIRKKATKYFESDAVKKYFKNYREGEYLLAFSRIALRTLRTNGIKLNQYQARLCNNERSYIHVKLKGKTAGKGAI